MLTCDEPPLSSLPNSLEPPLYLDSLPFTKFCSSPLSLPTLSSSPQYPHSPFEDLLHLPIQFHFSSPSTFFHQHLLGFNTSPLVPTFPYIHQSSFLSLSPLSNSIHLSKGVLAHHSSPNQPYPNLILVLILTSPFNPSCLQLSPLSCILLNVTLRGPHPTLHPLK